MKKSAAVFANKNMSNATCPRFAFSATCGPARSTEGVSSRLGNFGTFRARRITRPGARHARGSRPISPRTAAMAEEETTPAPPPPPPAPVLVHAWLPADPLPVLGEDEEAPARKPLDVILRDIPRRLKASAPVATQRRCREALADARAKLEALGEIAEDDEEAEAKNASKAELEAAIAEEEAALAEADAAYDELAASLCKGEHTTRAWVDSLNRYVDAGAREIIPDADRAHKVAVPGTTEPDAPGGGPNARRVVGDADDAAFASAADAAVTNAALLSRVACKAMGEFLTQAGVEKRAPASRTRAETKPIAVPRYEPNPFVGADAAVAGCEPWADAQIAALGDAVERLERVIIRWRDTAVPGVARVLVAMTAMGEDPDAAPESRKVGGAYVEVDDAGAGAAARCASARRSASSRRGSSFPRRARSPPPPQRRARCATPRGSR